MLWDVFHLKGRNKSNTFLIDDLYDVYKPQTKNVIRAEYFDASDPGSEKDNFLERLIPKLKKKLK